MKVAFVYPNPRIGLLEEVAAGRAPDTALWGQNHLGEYGIDTFVHEPRLRRRRRRSGLLHRITWNARELTLPWELAGADLVVTALASIFPLVARMGRRRPRVLLLSYHLCATFDRSGTARRRLLAAAVRSAAAVACASHEGRRCLLARTGRDAARTRVVHLGVDESFWTPAPTADDGYVLAVGRDLARDYGTLVRAVEPLGARTVIAAGPANVAGLELPPNVELRVDIGPREVRDLYAGAACVVVPIRPEGYRYGTENSGTIALLEAMATARPVVATERSTLAEYVRSGVTALTVPPEDADALRANIERVLSDRALARSLAASGRAAVENSFTTRHLARRLADLIRDVA